jgi:GNAT superfamily N-acetyltransferase
MTSSLRRSPDPLAWVHEISPVERDAVSVFVRLERDLMSDYPLFWSPPDEQVFRQLCGCSAPLHNAERRLFLVEKAGYPVARCAAIMSQARDTPRWGAVPTGFIGYFAAEPHAAAATAAMLERAEGWLARRGVRRVIAPHNGSVKIGMAVLTAAFDESPMFPLPWNPPYYRDYLQAAGYGPRYPLWVYEVEFRSERFQEASRRVLGAPRCDVRAIDGDRWAVDLETLRKLFNASMRERLSAVEFHETFPWLPASLDPSLVQLAFDGTRPIGFVIGLADLVPLFRGFRGELGPSELGRLQAARDVRRAGAIVGALLPQYRGRGVGSMIVNFYHSLEEMGLVSGLYYPVNHSNATSRGLAEAIGGHGRILYHCFEKFIR